MLTFCLLFFVRAELFDLFAMIESEFCFAFLFLILFFFGILLMYVFCSSSCGDKFIYVTCFWVVLYDVLHKRAVLVCAMRVNVCVCVCVCGAGQPSLHNTKNNFTCGRTEVSRYTFFVRACVCVRLRSRVCAHVIFVRSCNCVAFFLLFLPCYNLLLVRAQFL